jgi:hypothetical protein
MIVRILAGVLVMSPLATSSATNNFPASYKGTAYTDARNPNVLQEIPGRVQCALYDQGGEGVAYHDTDAANHGSGELNKPDGSYLHEFRRHEGVDISYTKFGNAPDRIDDSPFNMVLPPPDQLYVGWTEPGEWFNITVNVREAGAYAASLLYTSNRGGSIAIDVNGVPATAELNIPSTRNPADPVAWRQWHHWNVAYNLAVLTLPAGKTLLTVHIVSGGQMNLAYFDMRRLP